MKKIFIVLTFSTLLFSSCTNESRIKREFKKCVENFDNPKAFKGIEFIVHDNTTDTKELYELCVTLLKQLDDYVLEILPDMRTITNIDLRNISKYDYKEKGELISAISSFSEYLKKKEEVEKEIKSMMAIKPITVDKYTIVAKIAKANGEIEHKRYGASIYSDTKRVIISDTDSGEYLNNNSEEYENVYDELSLYIVYIGVLKIGFENTMKEAVPLYNSIRKYSEPHIYGYR